MGLFNWFKAKVPTIQQGQLYQLDQIDREHRRHNSNRIALEGELGRSQITLSYVYEWQAEEADRDPTRWRHQPEYYAARIESELNLQLGIRSELADIENRLTQLRTERMELIEKMNAPAESDTPSAVEQDQPAT